MFFWTHRWLHGCSIEVATPTVFAAVSTRKRKAIVAKVLHNNAWIRQITGPLTMWVLLQFDHLCDLLEGVRRLSAQPDTFAWRLTTYQSYSAASAYGTMFHR